MICFQPGTGSVQCAVGATVVSPALSAWGILPRKSESPVGATRVLKGRGLTRARTTRRRAAPISRKQTDHQRMGAPGPSLLGTGDTRTPIDLNNPIPKGWIENSPGRSPPRRTTSWERHPNTSQPSRRAGANPQRGCTQKSQPHLPGQLSLSHASQKHLPPPPICRLIPPIPYPYCRSLNNATVHGPRFTLSLFHCFTAPNSNAKRNLQITPMLRGIYGNTHTLTR